MQILCNYQGLNNSIGEKKRLYYDAKKKNQNANCNSKVLCYTKVMFVLEQAEIKTGDLLR